MSESSRASVASIARYWADAPELSDINTSPGQAHSVADLRFCLERCAELLAAPEPVYDGAKCLGERFQDAVFAGFGTMPVPAAYRVMPFGELPAEHQAQWNRAAVNFVAQLSS